MATEYVKGLESGDASGPSGDQGAGGPLRRLVHAVLRRDADGPPPWTAACGASVSEVYGSWDPNRGFAETETACPACLSRLAA